MSELLGDPAFLVTSVIAVLIVGIGKGGFAGGPVMIAVPLMSLVVDPLRAAAILLPILLVMDALAMKKWWRVWDRRELKLLLPGAVLGTLIGWATFRFLSADALRVLVGLLAAGYALQWFVSHRNNRPPREPHRTRALFWGSAAGFTSFAVHAGSPPLHVYLLGNRLDKSTFHATTVAFFFCVNWLKTAPYAMLGQLDLSNLKVSLVLAPLAPVAIAFGAWLHHKVNEDLFFRLTYAALGLLGMRLIYVGLT